MIGKTKTEEQLAIEAEHSAILASIESAKNEFIIIADDKKRVAQEKVDLETGNAKLIDDKSSLEDAIHILVDTKNNKEKELKDLEKEYADKKSILEASLPNTEKVLADLESKKIPILKEIEKLNSLILDSKEEAVKMSIELSNYGIQIKEITAFIEAKIKQEGNLNVSIEDKNKNLEELTSKVLEVENLIVGTENRKNMLASINKEIINNEARLAESKITGIKELEDELSGLKISIEKNKEINKEEESKHFALLNKQQALDSKEVFIKSQYERAGIKWEE